MDITAANFQRIKQFILRHGDRQTYCNKYNRNPHYDFGGFHVFLEPDVGQQNINCDPELSDFDTLVVQDWERPHIYTRWTVQDGRVHVSPHHSALNVYLARMLEAAQRDPG